MMKNSCMHTAIRELGTLFHEGAVGMLSDRQLLDRLVERRDASAFEAIVERYGPPLGRLPPRPRVELNALS